jgi:ppGpp synthetase/RelA/SpoT-type nucleotidyltranferase
MRDLLTRTAEDHLRAEYFTLLPQIRLTTEELEAEIRYLLIPLTRERERHERIVVKSRVKECESAIAALRRKQNWAELKASTSAQISLTALNDLAGVRILAFPKRLVFEIDSVLRSRFGSWVADPVPPAPGTTTALALKYHGFCSSHCRVRGEVQLMSMLIGMFWEVEHAALYKPGERLRDMEVSLKMQDRNADVIRAMCAFETQFEELVSAPSANADQQAQQPQATADFNTLCG